MTPKIFSILSVAASEGVFWGVQPDLTSLGLIRLNIPDYA